MKKKIFIITIIFRAVFSSMLLFAQDIHFSQFYENPLLRNPALTGIFSGDYKIGVNYRTQWSSVSNPYQTLMLSAETKFQVSNESNDNISFGLSLVNDKSGSIDFSTTQIYPAINYNKYLEDTHQSYLSLGFIGGLTQYDINASKMTFSSQFTGGTFNTSNPSNENITQTKLSFFDLGTGLSLNSSMGTNNDFNYYLGVAAFHLNKPKAAFENNLSFVRLDTKWNANFGFTKQFNNEMGMTSHFNYSIQGSLSEFVGGGFFNWSLYDPAKQLISTFSLGLFYRFQDAFIPTFRLSTKRYAYTISYDLNNSKLKTISKGQGAIEFSVYSRGLIDRFPWKRDNKNVCPRFEQMIEPILIN